MVRTGMGEVGMGDGMTGRLRLGRGTALAVLCLGVLAHPTASQPQTSKGRPRVGLVLSGGGARGLAHIGVIEWLEAHQIPVDYVAGTSMGGLVGGMYAMGWSPDEMRAFIRTIDWKKAFGTGLDHQERSFRRKEDRRDYQVDIELGLRHGLSMPSGWSTGHLVGLLLDRATLPYSTIEGFDELPIPFRCVGADVISAEEVIMKDGSLSTALRATMSIPGLFPPVRRDGRWLIDGGVLNNIPVDVMRAIGPDVVIAVDVGTPLGGERVVHSMVGVISQSLGVMMAGSDRKNLALADLVIKPVLGDLNITDFSDVDGTADLGSTAADEMAAGLLKYALDETSWREYLAQRAARKRVEIPTPARIQVTGVSNDASRDLSRQLRSYVGRPLDTNQVEEDLTRLAGEGRYESLDYGFIRDPGGNDILEVRVREKTYAPPSLNFSLGIEGSDISDIEFFFGTRLTFFDVGMYGTEWRNDLNVGAEGLVGSEYYVPLWDGPVFVAPRAFYSRRKQSLFLGDQRLAEYDVDQYGAGGDVGIEMWRSELRAGMEISHVDASLITGAGPIRSLVGKVDFARVRWAFDGANSATVPTKGIRATAEGRWYFDSPVMTEEFPQAELTMVAFKPLSSRASFFAAGGLGTTFGKDAAPAQRFTLGGHLQMGAYDEGELYGNHYALLSAGYMHQVYQMPPVVGGKAWLAAWCDVGGAFDDFSHAEYVVDGSVGLIVDTRLGPFSLFGSYGEGGSHNVYFAFGKFF